MIDRIRTRLKFTPVRSLRIQPEKPGQYVSFEESQGNERHDGRTMSLIADEMAELQSSGGAEPIVELNQFRKRKTL